MIFLGIVGKTPKPLKFQYFAVFFVLPTNKKKCINIHENVCKRYINRLFSICGHSWQNGIVVSVSIKKSLIGQINGSKTIGGTYMQTMKDLANEIGVSKVAISKKIEKLGLKDALIKDGNRYLLDDDIAEKVRASYKHRTTTESAHGGTDTKHDSVDGDPSVYADIIEVLREQLAEKDRQLEAKDKQIENLQVLMAQQLQRLLPEKTSEVEIETVSHAETQTQSEPQNENNQAGRKTFWSRLFG